MESPPPDANAYPEHPGGNMLLKLSNLLDIRAGHTDRLLRCKLIEKAQSALSDEDAKILSEGFNEAVIFGRPSRIQQDGREVIDPSIHEMGICFLRTRIDERGRPELKQVFSPIAKVTEGIPRPLRRGGVTFTFEEAVLVNSMVMELRDAKLHGEVPFLSQDLTAVVSYDS